MTHTQKSEIVIASYRIETTLPFITLQYLTTIRVQKAMDLLSNTPDKMEVVSHAVGYKDALSFSKALKKITGMPPKEFRNRDREDTPDKMEVVSQAVGNKDTFSFSKAFMKIDGIPPKEFRNRDREEKALSWRFQ